MARYRRRRSDVATLLSDAAYIAQRVSYKTALVIGAIGFSFFYWLIPAVARSQLERTQGTPTYALLEGLLLKRIHWVQWIGIALLLVMCFFALRQYLKAERLNARQTNQVSWLSRLLARFLD